MFLSSVRAVVCTRATVPMSIEEPIEEELLSGDRLQRFHPTQPSQLLDGRFETVVKLGFGTGSTVWLARNLQFEEGESSLRRYVAVKIGTLDAETSKEREYLKLIANAKPSHEGLSFIRTPIDDFSIEGPKGTHLCLVYQPMRETLFRLQQRCPEHRLPLPIFKLFTYYFLQALDYLHTECRLIHTDIKDNNIMVKIENDSVLSDFVSAQERSPHRRHINTGGRITYVSQNDFGPLRGSLPMPELGDFNLAFPGPPEGIGHLSPIQSHRYRAPEVLLGIAWTSSADIWNLGLLLWNLLENVTLFDKPAGEDGGYDSHVHLAKMVSLLGRPPEALITRERLYRAHKLPKPIVNPRGKVCKNMNEFWGGPFFDDDNQIVRKDLVEEGKALADTVTQLAGDEKDLFLDFAGGMLQWMPEKRKTAKQLLAHPFLDSFYKDRARFMRDESVD
ncbi:kinase domain protein [Nemania diffusa]|nr:kinase domain protein [Nemania diffusa]